MENQPAIKGDLYLQVRQKTERILAKKRNSFKKEELGDWYAKRCRKYADRNEATFIAKFFETLKSKGRNVQVLGKDDQAEDKPIWDERMWEEDGLDVNISQPFLRESLPRIDSEGKKVLQSFLNRHERIKNPTADRVYGVAEDAFAEEENTVNNMYNKFAGLSPGLYHVGLIFEFGRDKSVEEVEAQCARGSAAAVQAACEIRLAAGENIMQDGADLACVIYSFAVTPSIAHLSIH